MFDYVRMKKDVAIFRMTEGEDNLYIALMHHCAISQLQKCFSAFLKLGYS